MFKQQKNKIYTILMNLRFKECWAVWLFNNTVDLIIWIVNFINHTTNSTMMLLVSIGYLPINIYGLIKWYRKSRVLGWYNSFGKEGKEYEIIKRLE